MGRRPAARVRPLRAPGEELEQGAGVHRAGEEEPLSDLAAEVVQRVLLLWKLDALGDDVELEARAERDDRRGQRHVFARADEGTIHLQDVDREPAQIAER